MDGSAAKISYSSRFFAGRNVFVAFVAVYLALSLQTAFHYAAEPWPLTPWEAAITVDAWRINHHLPVYENPATGHATHMYGPLTTVAAAIGERIFSVDVRVPRAISLTAALLTAVGCGFFVGMDRGWRTKFLLGALTYLQFYRVGEWSTDARPDAASALWSLLALAAMYRAETSPTIVRRVVWMFVGSIGAVMGFLFKQPALVLCGVPLLVRLMTRRSTPRGGAVWPTFIPIVAAILTVLMIRFGFKWLYFYAMAVPASYPIPLSTLLKAPLECVHFNVLFIFALALAWPRNVSSDSRSPLHRIDAWLLVTTGVTLVFGIAARSKVGGGYNSLLPAFISMTAFAVRALDQRWRELDDSGTLLIRGAAVFVPCLIVLSDLASMMHLLLPGKSTILVQHGDAYYRSVITAVAGLPGRVVSYDDPTLVLLAKHQAGRSGDCECDANGRDLPSFAVDELRTADWVVQTQSSRRSTTPDEMLQKCGFEPAAWAVPARASYRLWKHGNSAG